MQAVRKGPSEQRDGTGSQLAFGVFCVRRAQSQPGPSPICPFSSSVLCWFLIKAHWWHRWLLTSLARFSQPHLKTNIRKTWPRLCDIPGNSAKADKRMLQGYAGVSSLNRITLSILEWHKQGTPKPGTGTTGKIAVGVSEASYTKAAISRGRIWMGSLCVLVSSIWIFAKVQK